MYSTRVDHGKEGGFKICEKKGHVAVGRRRKTDLSASWRGNTTTKGHTKRDKRVVRK